MKPKIFNENEETFPGLEINDSISPIVYKKKFEIIDDQENDAVDESEKFRVFVANNNFSMSTAFDGTGRSGFLEVDDEVYDLMDSKNPYLQWAATQVLGQVADHKSLNLLFEALYSEIFDVRWGAVMAIAELGKKWITHNLIRFINADDSERLYRIKRAFEELCNFKPTDNGDVEPAGE
jgi:hypothetical protein